MTSDKAIAYLNNLLFLFGIATAGITFYNEPFISFSGLPEEVMEQILVIQPIVCCITLMLGGRLADRYGWNETIRGMVGLATIGCLGFVGFRGSAEHWLLIGVCYGIMVGGYWSAYHLLELLLLREVTNHRRGECSAVITYINGFGNSIGIALFTLFLQFVPLRVIKIFMVVPILVVIVYLLGRCNTKRTWFWSKVSFVACHK